MPSPGLEPQPNWGDAFQSLLNPQWQINWLLREHRIKLLILTVIEVVRGRHRQIFQVERI